MPTQTMERDRYFPDFSDEQPSGDEEPRHAPQLAQALRLLEAGVDEILRGEGYQRYLDVMSRFHRYSSGNILLIQAQRPDATQVAGYRRWQALGRQVRRGERGIRIIVPHTARVSREDDEEGEVVRGWGVASVFDIRQTEGDALPEPPAVAELETASEAGFWLCDQLADLLEADGVLLTLEELDGPKGLYHPLLKSVKLQAGMSIDQTAKTLAHETAHHVAMHHFDVGRADAETVAESAAYVVLHRYGIDTSDYSFPYVARWAGERERFVRNLSSTQRTAHAMIGRFGERDLGGTLG